MQQHGPLVRFFHFCLSKDFNQRLKARSPRNRPQLSAGPPSITGDPEIDADGGMTALRQGTMILIVCLAILPALACGRCVPIESRTQNRSLG
jgi:hypothetical protein